jgi:hypothetical protein
MGRGIVVHDDSLGIKSIKDLSDIQIFREEDFGVSTGLTNTEVTSGLMS